MAHDLFNSELIPNVANANNKASSDLAASLGMAAIDADLAAICTDKTAVIILHYWKRHLDVCSDAIRFGDQDKTYRAMVGTLVNLQRCHGVRNEAHARQMAEVFFQAWLERRLEWL